MNDKLNEIAEKAEANLKKQNKKAEANLKKQSEKEKEVNDLAGERKDDGSYKTTKKEWDSGKSQQVIDKLFRNNTLQGLISSKIPFVKPPGFIEADFISASVEQLIPHIRGFNPEVNNSLSGWINSQLNNKVGNVFKKDEAGTKEKFETSLQTGKVDGTSIDVADTSTTIEENIDLKAVEKKDTAKAADKLRNITGITKEESGIQGDKIVGGKIRTEAVKGNKNPAKSDVGKAGALLFGDQVIEAMGGVLGSSKNKLGNYITFLEIRGDDVLSVLSDQNNLKNNQLSDLYKPNQVDRESTAEGNAVMEYGNPNPKVADLIAWATDPKLAPTTLINRQRSLANILGSLLGRASTVESIKTKTGKKKLVDTQELQGNKMKPDAISKLISDIDVRLKGFDGILAMGVSPKMIGDAIKGGLRIFDRAIKAGNSIQQAISKAVKKIQDIITNADVASVVSRFFADAFTKIKDTAKAIANVTDNVLVWAAASSGKVNVLLEAKGIAPAVTSIKNKNDINKAIEHVKAVMKLGPKEMWFGKGTGTAFDRSAKIFGLSSQSPLWKSYVKKVKALKIGPGIDKKSEMGPLVTSDHLKKVKRFIDQGVDEGADLVVDGRNLKLQGYEKGFYIGGFPNIR